MAEILSNQLLHWDQDQKRQQIHFWSPCVDKLQNYIGILLKGSSTKPYSQILWGLKAYIVSVFVQIFSNRESVVINRAT